MDDEPSRFKELVKSSSRILITSHISPDPDAVSSVLLLGKILKLNFPDKEVSMVLEESPARSLDFLAGYKEIEFRPILAATKELEPNLFVLLDAPNFERCSRNQSHELRELLSKNKKTVVIIDHHESHGKDNADLYINNRRPATVQEIYELLFEKMQLKRPANYEQTTLLGIISDTDRHKFDNPHHRQTYRIVSDLIDAGASIEELETNMQRYDTQQLKVFNNLISHITDSKKGYTYSYIDDDLAKDWLQTGRSQESYKLATEALTQQFLKNFEKNLWGFIVYLDIVSGEGMYGASFRSTSGVKDVSKIAHLLGGGGHKPAAGAKFAAKNIEEALEKVKKVINGADDED